MTPSPVKAAALELGIAVRTPERVTEIETEIRSSGAQLGVVVAFGQILKPSVLAAVPGGFLNLHFSLLPRWRGAAPVERAILAGDQETGVCLMQLDPGMDTGPVLARRSVTIGIDETAGELSNRLVDLGTDLLVTSLDELETLTPVPQADGATTAARLTVAEFELDWTQPGEVLARCVRAGNPRPGAWTMIDGQRLKVWRAAASADSDDEDARSGQPGLVLSGGRIVTGSGILRLLEVQPDGKAKMAGAAWAVGRRGESGTTVAGT